MPMPQAQRAQSVPVSASKPEPLLEMTNGVLTKESLLKVFETIRTKLTARYKEIHDQFVDKRRLNRENKEEYSKCA